MKQKEYRPLHILCHNGWKWLFYDKDKLSVSTTECSQYSAEFLGDTYSSTVVAIVSEHTEHLGIDGHYGVLWLEAKYENDRNGCYSWDDMEDMMSAIENAEGNLLMIGMPFTEDYEFHGRNRANMKRRNDKLRRLYGLAEKERNDWYGMPQIDEESVF